MSVVQNYMKPIFRMLYPSCELPIFFTSRAWDTGYLVQHTHAELGRVDKLGQTPLAQAAENILFLWPSPSAAGRGSTLARNMSMQYRRFGRHVVQDNFVWSNPSYTIRPILIRKVLPGRCRLRYLLSWSIWTSSVSSLPRKKLYRLMINVLNPSLRSCLRQPMVGLGSPDCYWDILESIWKAGG
jgi:hypothetical protein